MFSECLSTQRPGVTSLFIETTEDPSQLPSPKILRDEHKKIAATSQGVVFTLQHVVVLSGLNNLPWLYLPTDWSATQIKGYVTPKVGVSALPRIKRCLGQRMLYQPTSG